MNAFTVTAFDGVFLSSTAVQATIHVQALPTLTTISTMSTAAPQVPFSISYATLLADSNAQDFNSAAIQFLVNGVQNGTLTITHGGVTTAVVAGTTLVVTGDSLTWTGPAGVTGSAVNAFTVTAFDGVFLSSTAVQATIHVQALPTLTTISTLGTASPQTPFAISYATLLAASNAQDFNGAPIQFRINYVQNGTLTITHNGVTTAVVAGTTLVGTGDSLTWTGPAGVTGSAVNAFTVTAFDGTLSSSTAIQATIDVQAIINALDLSGAWIVDSGAGVVQGLGQITQSGSNVTFVNFDGVSSSGQQTAPNQVVATNFDNLTSVTGTIDTSAADLGRIVFSDGSVWLRMSLGGQYSVTGTGINSPTLACDLAKRPAIDAGQRRNLHLCHDQQCIAVAGLNQWRRYGDGDVRRRQDFLQQ